MSLNQLPKYLVTGDYGHDLYSSAEFGGNPSMGASGQIGKI